MTRVGGRMNFNSIFKTLYKRELISEEIYISCLNKEYDYENVDYSDGELLDIGFDKKVVDRIKEEFQTVHVICIEDIAIGVLFLMEKNPYIYLYNVERDKTIWQGYEDVENV